MKPSSGKIVNCINVWIRQLQDAVTNRVRKLIICFVVCNMEHIKNFVELLNLFVQRINPSRKFTNLKTNRFLVPKENVECVLMTLNLLIKSRIIWNLNIFGHLVVINGKCSSWQNYSWIPKIWKMSAVENPINWKCKQSTYFLGFTKLVCNI